MVGGWYTGRCHARVKAHEKLVSQNIFQSPDGYTIVDFGRYNYRHEMALYVISCLQFPDNSKLLNIIMRSPYQRLTSCVSFSPDHTPPVQEPLPQ